MLRWLRSLFTPRKGAIVIRTDEDMRRFNEMVLKEWHEWHDSKLADN